MRIPAATSIASIVATIAAMATMAILVSTPALGQQSAADCANVEDDRERLECYDRFYSGARDTGADESASSSSPRSRDSAASRDGGRARNAAASSSRDRAPARVGSRDRRSEPEPEPETAEDRFGKEKKVLELGGDQMSSTAIGQFDYWNRGQRIELENGQIWEIIDTTNLFHKSTDPRVTIEKGLFSSFYMRIDGVSKGLKVRRIR
ncbi:MAG: hypothetical protein WD397_09000 [Wenzhouxiangellaceae bacterium]